MMGKIAMKERGFQKAISTLLKSAALNNGRNKELLNRVYETIAACYETMGQPEKAYPYLKFTHSYNDSMSRAREASNNRYVFIASTSLVINPLPLTLLSFAGRSNEAGVLLNWVTTDEKNVSHFDIERSMDGATFTKIGSVRQYL